MNTQKGFTLIELLITVVVIAILAAIAIPNYQSYMLKTRRASAAACLLELSQAIERFHTVKMSYAGFALPDTQCSSTDLAEYYAFDQGPVDGQPTAQTYTLRAVPKGAQDTNDPDKCGTLTINQAGQKGVGANGNLGRCWR